MGREVLVGFNSGDCPPHMYAFAQHADLIAAEQHETEYRQPSWCRYAAGFADERALTVVEQPFNGVIPELVRDLKAGRAYDRLRIMHYEAAALGAVEQDSFWAPHKVLVEIQSFLADHEDLYSTRTFSETAVAFSVASAFEHQEAGGGRDFIPFFDACDALVREHQPFDVVMFPAGELRPDVLGLADLAQYRTLVLLSCTFLTPHQAGVVRGFLDRGGHVLASGETGLNLTSRDRSSLLDHPLWRRVDEVRASDLADGPQALIDDVPDLAINLQRTRRGVAVHLVRYDYDETADAVPILPELVVRIRLPRWCRRAHVFTPSGGMRARLGMSWHERGTHRLELRDVPLYSATLLRG